MEHPEILQLVSIREIAEMTGLTFATAQNYRKLGRLPEPDFELAIGPIWYAETIEQWDRERNRKPGPGAEAIARMRKVRAA